MKSLLRQASTCFTRLGMSCSKTPGENWLARTVLSWLRNGFKPKFVGTAGAKPEKLKVALQMLRKVMPEKEIRKFLAGRFPQRLEFWNHASLFKKWNFSSEQIFKLVQVGAAGIWEFPDPPIIIHPMGVVDSAGKDRMIVNARCLNLFLEPLPFRYERLRDILAFTGAESFLATWDL
jgi:hypothetical protein